MSTNNVWTPDREMELVALWEQDFSASQIAKKMGGVSRNAVLGKRFRIKLAKRTNRNAAFYKLKAPLRVKRKYVRKPVIPLQKSKPGLVAVTSVITGTFMSVMRRHRAPEMTKPELRAMLTQAMINTGGVV